MLLTSNTPPPAPTLLPAANRPHVIECGRAADVYVAIGQAHVPGVPGGATRERLTADTFVAKSENDPVGALELALQETVAAEEIEARIRTAHKERRIAGRTPDELAQAALEAGVITPAEQAQLKRRDELRNIVIWVDDFPRDFGVKVTPEQPQLKRIAA